MPFAEMSVGVSRRLEQARQQDDIRIEPVGHPASEVLLMTGKVLLHTMPGREVSRDDRGPAG